MLNIKTIKLGLAVCSSCSESPTKGKIKIKIIYPKNLQTA